MCESASPSYQTARAFENLPPFFSASFFRACVCVCLTMAPGFESVRCDAANMSSKDPASKRKRVNRSAKLKQCKLEARREQWLANQATEEKQEERDPCTNDPGEVLHPDFPKTAALLPIDSRVSWASRLNSTKSEKNLQKTQSTARLFQAEPDPELLRANSNSHTHLCIKRSELIPSLSTNEHAFYECDVSPKSGGDRSPKSKASKMGKGSRRSGNGQRNSKENECIVAEQKKDNKGQERKSDGTQVNTRTQDRPYCYDHETDDGWEAAVEALGLLPAPKKCSSGILQVKATPCNDQRQTRTKMVPLLGMKPAKQPGLQHNMHRRAWMQNDWRRPTSFPSLNTQRGLCASTCLNDLLDKPQCPICTEDLDSTDTSFDSCPCGFNLCLFCYHKIASENGRCPGCRGVYSRDVSAKPAVLLPR